MIVSLSIGSHNASFDEHPAQEVARILRAVAYRCDQEDGPDVHLVGPIHDINGNLVGSYNIDAEYDPNAGEDQ